MPRGLTWALGGGVTSMWKTMADPTFAALTAIRHWSNKAELAQFALDRHGFGDTDGGFGITYPNDLDEYDKSVLVHVSQISEHMISSWK